MSDTLVSENTKSEKFKEKLRQRKPRASEVDDFRSWLGGLGFQSAPSVHVNGVAHPTAVITVDFGTPLSEPTKLSAEQAAELIGYIRSVTKSLYRDREANVRVQSDTSTGVWWASVG